MRQHAQEYTPWDAQAQRQHDIQEAVERLEEMAALCAFGSAEESGVLAGTQLPRRHGHGVRAVEAVRWPAATGGAVAVRRGRLWHLMRLVITPL